MRRPQGFGSSLAGLTDGRAPLPSPPLRCAVLCCTHTHIFKVARNTGLDGQQSRASLSHSHRYTVTVSIPTLICITSKKSFQETFKSMETNAHPKKLFFFEFLFLFFCSDYHSGQEVSAEYDMTQTDLAMGSFGGA